MFRRKLDKQKGIGKTEKVNGCEGQAAAWVPGDATKKLYQKKDLASIMLFINFVIFPNDSRQVIVLVNIHFNTDAEPWKTLNIVIFIFNQNISYYLSQGKVA